MNDKLLSLKEVADRLGLNPETIRRWTKSGKLPAVKLGPNTVRVKELDLQEFIESRGGGGGG
ncbi:MAG: helix-turn-helix domain-containing protein [Actinobacteria bacterium]|nr:helix-turn-helix domain-containing protein [Actinomycetota bacterium]